MGLVIQHSTVVNLENGGSDGDQGEGTTTTEASATMRSNFLRNYSGYIPYITKVPLLSLYNHLVIYLFLPIAKKSVAVAFGCVTSLICIGLFLGIESSQVGFPGLLKVLLLTVLF